VVLGSCWRAACVVALALSLALPAVGVAQELGEDTDRAGVRERDPRTPGGPLAPEPGEHEALGDSRVPVDEEGEELGLPDTVGEPGPHAPEPMVFDLVRGLGARAGEVEVNVLGLVDEVNGALQIAWAPEIEVAITDGLGIELEIPIVNLQVEAIKVAVQQTLPPITVGFAHGLQLIAEVPLEGHHLQLVALHIVSLRRRHATLTAITGGRFDVDLPHEPDRPGTGLRTAALVNLLGGVDLSHNVVLAAEVNLALPLEGVLEARVMPQVHVMPFDHFRIQAGAGIVTDEHGPRPQVAFRVIGEL
jgi:hypothetical protein